MTKKTINFVIAPGSQFNSGLDLDSLLTFLSNNSSFSFKAVQCKSYEEAIIKLTEGKAEMGWLGGHFSSSNIEKSENIEPFAVGLPEGQKSTNYSSIFITKNNSEINKLKDVKGKKIVVNNVYSTSGYIIPKIELSNLGIELDKESEFSKVIKTKNHDEAIQLLLNGDADVAAVSSINFDEFVSRDKKNANKLRLFRTNGKNEKK